MNFARLNITGCGTTEFSVFARNKPALTIHLTPLQVKVIGSLFDQMTEHSHKAEREFLHIPFQRAGSLRPRDPMCVWRDVIAVLSATKKCLTVQQCLHGHSQMLHIK